MGESYFGVMQYLVAATQPPSLKTIVPFDAWTDIYRDTIYHGGLYNTGFQSMWLSTMYELLRPCPGDPPTEKWLPSRSVILDTVMRETDGPYYWERSAHTKFDKITVPIYHIACASRHYNHRQGQLNAYTQINTPKKLLIGPERPAEFFYSEALCEQIARWLDFWLKGIDTGIMNEPEVTLYMGGTNEWRYEFEFPLARTQWTKLYLHTENNRPASQPPYGLLGETMPGDEPPDSYEYLESRGVVEANLPVLAYSTPPLAKDMEVVGPATLVLYASSSADDVPWMINIDDVAPDGSFEVISKGWLRASHREVDEASSKPGQPYHPHTNPLPIEPNKPYDFEIGIWPICRTFRAGHSMRLRIASWESPKWDAHHFHVVLERPSKNTFYHNREYPSYLLLPIIPLGSCPTNLVPDINYKTAST
jgi:predicted acyl esterase